MSLSPSVPSPKRPYTPVLTRQDNVSFRLQERDVFILQVLNRYRYLRTNQIKRLIFPENRSVQSCRKRLKYLFHNGLVGRINPFVAPGAGQPDTAYFLEKFGAETLAQHFPEEEVRFYGKSGKVRYQFLSHALALSEFRMYLEIALQSIPHLEMGRFVADFEVKAHLSQATGHKRYKLWQEVAHPVSKQSFVVYPDGLIILRGAGDFDGEQLLLFVEIDRGTEGMRVIQEKVIGYQLYFEQAVHKKFGAFDGFRVLLQTTSPRRAENMRKALMNMQGADLVWIADQEKVWEDSILQKPIWQDHLLEWKSVLRLPS